MNTLLYVYLISARGNFFQRNTQLQTYGTQLLQCCRKMMPSAPTPCPPCHMMPLFISARLYFYVSQNSSPLSEFKGNHSRLIRKEFAWRIHLWRDPWNHRNYTDCLFLHAGELRLKPSASNSPLACVRLMFESGIIQWAPQEAFIWLSLCFPASAAGATIREDTQSCSLFWHLCQRKKWISTRILRQTCCIYIPFISHQLGKKLKQ